ncbi:hypothetical protein AB6A40_003455 [Gnathostoma spinigerum]|uniref:Uncharacterized protein n=1 Tax=Gnathostoma spinigerum TaxID=75299 RepID=A0ABD6EAT7_9BILA
MSSARKINMFERLANMCGHIYRHQARQAPGRIAKLVEVFKMELAPPRPTDWPAIQRDFRAVISAIQTKTYMNYTVREAAVYVAVGFEVLFWFFVGEMIGRRYMVGYLVPATYVSKATQKKAKEMEEDNPSIFK